MGVDLWGILSTCVSIVVGILVYVLTKKRAEEIHKSTRKRAEEIIEYFVNLVPNLASDPDAVRRLLEDYERAGEWRGKVFIGSDNRYHIHWKP